MRTFKEVQIELDNFIQENGNITLRHYRDMSLYKHDYRLSIEEFINKFFGIDISIIESINNNYDNIVNGSIYCDVNRKRSIGDLYLICKSFYPDITLYQLKRLIHSITNNGELCSFICSDIKKRVFTKPNISREMGYYRYYDCRRDEYGWLYNITDKLDENFAIKKNMSINV